LDDLLGTGTQITRFIARYALEPAPTNMHLVYVPLLATSDGLRRVREECPSLHVWPIEELDASAHFFHPKDDDHSPWSRDGLNTVLEAKTFYNELVTNRGIGQERQYSLSLTALMPERCPNNSLRVYWYGGAQWHPLKAR
jgi:hypothetical protein